MLWHLDQRRKHFSKYLLLSFIDDSKFSLKIEIFCNIEISSEIIEFSEREFISGLILKKYINFMHISHYSVFIFIMQCIMCVLCFV